MTSLLVINAPVLQAQDFTLDLANRLYEAGSYDAAITEYKRFLYFNPDHDSAAAAYGKIGFAHREQEQWPEALAALRQAVAATLSDRNRDDIRLDLAVILLSQQRYAEAEFELLRVAHFSADTVLARKAFFFLGIHALYTYQWPAAQKNFRRFFADSLAPEAAALDSLLQASARLKHKSPRTARLLAIFVPGAGQIYSGDWRAGLNALALNALTGYLLFDAVFAGELRDVVLTNLTLFERYYRGNIGNAQKAARRYNERTDQAFAQKILLRLQLLQALPQ